MNLKFPTLIILVFWVSAILAQGIALAESPAQSDQRKIVAIGDLHGDYEGYTVLLTEAGLINEKGKWAGGETILVQVGDVADRGPDSRKIIEHLQKLEKQARKKGGQVITLVGNHEAMNMTGDMRYVHPGEYAAFKTGKSRRVRDRTYKANKKAIEAYYLAKDRMLTADLIKEKWEATMPLGKLEHQTEWAPGGEIGEWVVENPAVVIIGDTLFVHGGVSSKYTPYSVDQMNMMAADALMAQDETPSNIINDEWGPLWYRGFIPGQPRPDCLAEAVSCDIAMTPGEELNFVLKKYGVSRMVVGHTPAPQGIKASYGGKLLQIDTGIAPYYGGTRSYLRIENSRLFAHDNGQIREIGIGPW